MIMQKSYYYTMTTRLFLFIKSFLPWLFELGHILFLSILELLVQQNLTNAIAQQLQRRSEYQASENRKKVRHSMYTSLRSIRSIPNQVFKTNLTFSACDFKCSSDDSGFVFSTLVKVALRTDNITNA